MPSRKYTEVHYEDLIPDAAGEIGRLFRFAGLECSDESVAAIVEAQRFAKQAVTGGTPFRRKGDVGARPKGFVEPPGFFRRGATGSWRLDLAVWEKLVVRRYTRRLMWACGYSWKGRTFDAPLLGS